MDGVGNVFGSVKQTLWPSAQTPQNSSAPLRQLSSSAVLACFAHLRRTWAPDKSWGPSTTWSYAQSDLRTHHEHSLELKHQEAKQVNYEHMVEVRKHADMVAQTATEPEPYAQRLKWNSDYDETKTTAQFQAETADKTSPKRMRQLTHCPHISTYPAIVESRIWKPSRTPLHTLNA